MIIFKATRFSRTQKVSFSSNLLCFRRSEVRKRKTQMTKMILFITFLYIVLSLPGVIVTGYMYDYIYSLDVGLMLVNLINAVQFSYPALNFIILCFSNKMFANEVKSMIFKFRSTNRISHSPSPKSPKPTFEKCDRCVH